MYQSKLAELQKAAYEFTGKARELAEKAHDESRSMTEDEARDYGEAMAKAKDLAGQIKTVKHDMAVLTEAKSLAEEIGEPAVDDLEAQGKTHDDVKGRMKSLGFQVVNSEQFKNALAPYAKSGRIPEQARVHTSPIPVKGLITSGTQGTGSADTFVTPDQSGIVETLGRRALTIRNLVSVRRTTSDAIEYVRQVARESAAAVVPEASTTAPVGDDVTAAQAGVKPEGGFTFERDTTNVVTIAEWVPATKRALADVAQMEGLINDELRADILEAEEDQILNGNGVGENLTGLNATEGVQVQDFDSDLFTSVRKAITKARTVGRVTPNGIVVSPAVAEAIDLYKDGNERFYFGGPQTIGVRTLWGLPVIESEAQPDGTALLGDFRKAVLWDREDTTVTFTDSHADFFIRNMVAILAEERLGFALTRPTALVKVGTGV